MMTNNESSKVRRGTAAIRRGNGLKSLTVNERIAALFAGAHAEGRATMNTTEFQLAASVAGLTDSEVRAAISDDFLRRGITGYWLREKGDPGARLVFANAMIDHMRNRDEEG